jgi:hypothetical protein
MDSSKSLQAGDAIPHFDVLTLGGTRINYARSIWQRSHLLLVALAGADAASDAYASRIRRLVCSQFDSDVACVLTRDAIAGVDGPCALVADRWGEIQFVAAPGHVEALPVPDELKQWIDFVRSRCPECEGEAR